MKECPQQYFEDQLKALQNDPQSGLTGPFTHAAPMGNMFRDPFREQAWMIGEKVVLKRVWTPETDWHHYRNEDGNI